MRCIRRWLRVERRISRIYGSCFIRNRFRRRVYGTRYRQMRSGWFGIKLWLLHGEQFEMSLMKGYFYKNYTEFTEY